ncbi:MAG: zf-HC2 domain-containing protein [Desulfobulbaceae bacterium]|nr:zf-HC2 domain-containing protein [Desulfobulbaceae bacterium]
MIDQQPCHAIQEMFSALVDHELDADASAQIKAHLAACPHCALEWHSFSESCRLLKGVAMQPVPADFLPGIHGKLAGPRPLLPRFLEIFSHPSLPLSSLATAGALIIAVTLFHSALSPSGHTDATPERQTAEYAMTPMVTVGMEENTRQAMEAMNSLRPSPVSFSVAPPSTLPGDTVIDMVPIGPDLTILVHASTRESQAHLYRRLLSQNHWRIHPTRHGTLIVFLDAEDLPSLRHALVPHRVAVEMVPSRANDLPASGPMTVALRLQAD